MRNQDPVTSRKLVSKVVRCLYRDVYLNLVSRILTAFEYKAINLSTLQGMAEAQQLSKIGINELIEAGFISSSQLVKILAKGNLTAKLEVEAHAFSKSAEAAIQAVGGTVVKL